jgi:hypothetical protein
MDVYGVPVHQVPRTATCSFDGAGSSDLPNLWVSLSVFLSSGEW